MKPQLITEEAEVKKRRHNPEQQRLWYLKNAEKKKEYVKKRYLENRENRISWAKEYRIRRPEVTLASRLKCNYGISVEQYNSMLYFQGNKCAICEIPFSTDKRNTKPHVDHCHKNGTVRGILCHVCNMSIGHIEKDGFLEKALIYLKQNKQ